MSVENEFSVQLRVLQQKHSAAAHFQCFFHWCCCIYDSKDNLSWERSLTTGSQTHTHTHTHTHTPPVGRCWGQVWCWQELCRFLLLVPLAVAGSALRTLGSTHSHHNDTSSLSAFIFHPVSSWWKLNGTWSRCDGPAAVQMHPAGLLLTGCHSAEGCTAEVEACRGQRTGEPQAPPLWLPDTPPYPAHSRGQGDIRGRRSEAGRDQTTT